MALGDTKNGNVPTLTKDNQLPSAVVTAPHSNDQMEKGSSEKVASKTNKQIDATISFLRAGRSGEIGKVIEFLESGQVTDINTCNANGLNALHLAAKDGYIDIVSELLRRGANVDNATKKGNTALHIASLAGQKEVIKLLIQYNANVNVQSLNGFTPLYMAAQENHDACVRYLLAKGANPSLATEDGFTPLAVAMQQGHDKVVAVLLESDSRGKVRLPALHIAAKKDDVKAATLLLENEHNPDIVSKSGFTPLHIAAHYGNVDIAKLLIERGADVNYIAKHNITPLHVACKWGKTNILQLLLSKNARIDATTRDGLTPLHCAARSGHKEVIELLLENDAPILSKTKNGLAPLHMAAQGEHDEAARILLMHKAPVDEVTVDYLTALHVSAHCGHVKVAKLLLDHNADPNARALNGFTPLHIACKKNRIKVVELLLKHNASISATTESGLTPLHVASFMGCMNIVIYLLQHDANPDAPTVRGETPLHLAARANQTDIIRILLRNGAQVDAKAREGQTPLHVASRLGNTDIIMLMLQHGANVDSTTKDAYTPLHIAAKEGQEEVAALLIENNASLDAVTKKSFSPLHLAAKYGKVQVAQLLLQKGANVDCQGKNGVTPIHVASHYDHQNIALLLLEKGASPHTSAKNGHTALHIAAKKNQMEIATNLLQFGADPNAKSKSGFAPLHLASQEGHVDMVNLLLEHGADPNVSAKNGLTPMHLCAQEDKADVARILLDHNAQISERTKGGYSPLHVAAHFGQITMVKFLLENDANIELSTNIGYTPLHQAAQQGHTLVINLLLTHKANPNALTNHGQTALSIANKLGYVTAVETLKVVTEKSVTNTVTGVLEEKYKVVAPESMHEAFMSDSEDEGGEDHLDQHQYKYMATDDLKTMINESDQNNYDTTDDDQLDGINRKAVTETMSTKYVNQNMSPTNAYQIKSIDNVTIIRPPVHLGHNQDVDSFYLLNDLECCLESFGGRMRTHPMCRESFLVSFLVDARGGAMRGCRHSGVRVIVPPKSCAQPTRITCRYVKPQRVPNPPPLMEGEALVSRVMELSPVEAKFLGPVILEVPHFGSLRDKEREIIILRSDNGETWREHTLYDSEEAVRDVLNETFESNELSHLEDLHTSRIVRIITRNFPHFFAVVSRIRQEVHAIGPDGGTVSSTAVPQVQAIFPPNALTKKIRVGLQAQPVDLNGCCKLLGQGVAVSPVVTVEPRRRKFHKAITLSIPAPKAYTQGMVNQYSGNAPTLRLLCSITGGQNRAVWEDVTGSTPLAFVKDSVSFTTTVSARFWLMDCRNVSDASRMATELYSYMAQVPFMVKFVVFAKRISNSEAKLSVFCMTDDKEDKTLEHQEYFTEVAKSRDVEILEDQDIYLEFAGNLVPVLKSGEQLNMKFHAFRENRLSFLVRVKDQEEPFGRMSFMSEPKIGKGEPPQTPICTLNVTLTGREIIEDNRTGSQKSLDHSLNYRDMLNFGYRQAEEIHKADIRLSDICNLLEDDWVPLAKELQVPDNDIELIKSEYNGKPASQQAMVMLRLWLRQAGANANGNTLEQALHKINRSDIVEKCIFNLELVTDYMEKAVAKMQLDQSGFETLKDELGPSSADSSFVQQERKKTNLLDAEKSNPLPASTESLQMDEKQQGEAARKSNNENFDEDTELNGQHESANEDYNNDFMKNNMKTSSPERKEVIERLSSVKCSTPPPTPIEINNVQNFETVVIRPDDADELHQKLITENPETIVVEVPSKKVVTTISVQQQQQQLIEPKGHAQQPQSPQQTPKEDDVVVDLSPKSVIETERHDITQMLPREGKQLVSEVNRSQIVDEQSSSIHDDVVNAEPPVKAQSQPSNLDSSSKVASLDNVEEDENFMEISSSNLADVIESDNAPSLSHDAEIVSLTSDVGCSDDIIYDDDQGLVMSRIPKSTISTTTTSTNVIHSPVLLEEQTTKLITKDTRTTRSSDGSECVVVVTESRQINDAGAEVIVRETVTKKQLKDGTKLPPQVQTTVITMDSSEPNLLSSEISSEIGGTGTSTVTSPGGTGGFGTNTTNISSNTNSANNFGANTGTTGAANAPGNDSPFYNPSTKSKTSSTKSLENNFNKTYGSSSDSDIALHEPGVELSEDEEHTEPEFYQGMEQPTVETIVQTVTSNDDDGNTIKTTTTTTTTKSSVIRDNIDDIQSEKELLEKFLENSILDVAATAAANVKNDLKEQQQQQAPFGSGYSVEIKESPIISTITKTTVTTTKSESQQPQPDEKHDFDDDGDDDVQIVEQQQQHQQQSASTTTNNNTNKMHQQYDQIGTLPSIVIDPIKTVVEDFVNQEKRNY